MTSPKTRATTFRIDSTEKMTSGALRVHGRLTKTGVFTYAFMGEAVREIRTDSEVFASTSLDTLLGAPVTIDHPAGLVGLTDWDHLVVGNVIRVDARTDGSPYVTGTIQLHDPKAIALVESKKLVEVSLGYETDPVEHENALEADFAQTNIVYNHAALGPSGWGRLGSDVSLRLDSDGNIDLSNFRMDADIIEEVQELRFDAALIALAEKLKTLHPK